MVDELYVQPYEWVADDRDGIYSVRIWTHNKDSERVLVRVEDYKPFCRIELPSNIGNKDVRWSKEAMEVYKQWLDVVLEDDKPVEVEYKYLKKLYWYRPNKLYPFLICRFDSEEALRHCINLVNKKAYFIKKLAYIKATVWETDLTHLHRLVTEVKVGYGQWFKAMGEKVPDMNKISTCKHEYIVPYKSISPLSEAETKGWTVSPTVCAFDIECYSENHQTMPKQDYVNDVVFQISYIVQKLGDPTTRKRYLLTTKDTDIIENAEIIKYSNEIDMINGMCELINITDPTVITGYNIYKFDLPYMDARMKLYFKDWIKCGLIKDKDTFIPVKRWKSSAYGFMTISKIEAEGRITLDMFPIIKRDHKLDRYTLDFVAKHFLKRGKHPVTAKEMFQIYERACKAEAAMSSFESSINSETPASETPASQIPTNEISTNEIPTNEISTNEIPTSQIPNCETPTCQISASEISTCETPTSEISATETPTSKIPTINKNKILENLAKSRAELAVVGKYCLEDSCLCIDLMETLNTWIMLIELASIVQVCPTEIFSRGQQIRVQNQIYQYAYNENFVLDKRPGSKDGFVGGQVVTPVPGRFYNVIIFDFASLYPSIIRAFNICFTTLIPPENTSIPDEMCHVLKWSETDEKTGEVKNFCYRFIKQEYYHGILPRMCEHLVMARKQTRGQINDDNPPLVNTVLNQRQNGLKVSANSIFGALGVQSGRAPLPEAAKSITAMGRVLITKAADYVRTVHKGDIVYGDTDSIMVNMNIHNPNECITIGEKLSKEVTALYPKPLSLEFERAISVALFIKKKKYAGVPLGIIELVPNPRTGLLEATVEKVDFFPEYNIPTMYLYKTTQKFKRGSEIKTEVKYLGIPKDVDIEGLSTIAGLPLLKGGAPDARTLMKKGIVLARRDNCVWVRKTYQNVLLNILFNKSMEETLQMIDNEIMRMVTLQIPFEDMLVTREIGSNYKPNSSYPLKLFADELRKQGHPIQSGERIDYVFVVCEDDEKNKKQGWKMRIPEMYITNRDREPMDYVHYIEKILKNPIEQIVYIAYKDQIDDIERRCEPEHRRRGKIYTYIKHDYINTWVKLLKYKRNLTNTIKYGRFRFATQDAYFMDSFKDD